MTEQRALLLTDVVDSTLLAERLGDAAAAELGAVHDRVARDLLRAWRGREIDKTDGMLMLFDAAADALGFAIAYHAALAALPQPLKARAGLHFGAVILRNNPPEDVAHGAKPLEVEGIAKPLAARVMSLALGGQTLLTAEARAALGETALRVVSHGFWRIKGIAEPVELFEAGADDAPFTPPPDSAKVYRVVRHEDMWLPRREVRHNLPAERDAFIGRRDSLAALARLFDSGVRLVSVLGIGGTGKTRLALRFAWTRLGDYPGGVWFCDLALARDVDSLLHAVAQGLDVPLGVGDPLLQLGHAIAGRGPCLLILDNFEQIARHAERTLGHWLDRAPEARFLVTTREVLGLLGEQSLALPPLARDDANDLFLQRAAAAQHGFMPAGADRQAIPALVELLDGLPLAIELAAARVRMMSPSELLARMHERFRLLVATGGRRDRQATLRAAFDWSWDLLSEAEKSALAQLSVFEGGFTLPTAERVLALSGSGSGQAWAIDVLQSLVDKSLVQRKEGERLDLLVSVQEYAAEHLRTPGRFTGSGAQALQQAVQRHGRCFAELAVAQPAHDSAPDLANLIVACRRAAQRGEAQVSVPALEGAWQIIRQRGPLAIGVELAGAVKAGASLDALQRARCLLVMGSALDACGRVDEAAHCLDEALAQARTAGDRGVEGAVLVALGELHGTVAHPDDARNCHSAALDIARSLGDDALRCAALNGLGTACIDRGDTQRAREHYQEALQVARSIGDRRWECGLLGNLGGLCMNEGRLVEAEAHLQQELQIARALGIRTWEGSALCNLGALHHVLGRLEESRQASLQALQMTRALGHRRMEGVVLCNLGLVGLELGAWTQAAEDYASALALARELEDRRSEGLYQGYLAQVLGRQGRFDEARRHVTQGLQHLEQVTDRFSLGIVLCHHAEVEHLAGDPAAAHDAAARARSIAVELGAGAASELGVALKRVETLLTPDELRPAASGS
jgi:predicted ATPase/class 3 adenylate cyclase/Flp pilus assembly protein TadD